MLLNQKFKNRESKSDGDQMGTKCLYFPKLLNMKHHNSLKSNMNSTEYFFGFGSW